MIVLVSAHVSLHTTAIFASQRYPCDNLRKYLIYAAASHLPIKSALCSDILFGDGVLKRI